MNVVRVGDTGSELDGEAAVEHDRVAARGSQVARELEGGRARTSEGKIGAAFIKNNVVQCDDVSQCDQVGGIDQNMRLVGRAKSHVLVDQASARRHHATEPITGSDDPAVGPIARPSELRTCAQHTNEQEGKYI